MSKTMDEVRNRIKAKALTVSQRAKSIQAVKQIFMAYGSAERLSEIKPEDYAAVEQALDKVLH